jgi:hypothetical protein
MEIVEAPVQERAVAVAVVGVALIVRVLEAVAELAC